MTDQITKTLISGLRTQRQAAGYTQEMLGQLLKIQRATYCNYENGIRTPSLEILVTLAELYHVSTDYLIRGIDSYLCTNPTSQKIAQMVDNMPQASQQDVLGYTCYRNHFPFSSKKNFQLKN